MPMNLARMRDLKDQLRKKTTGVVGILGYGIGDNCLFVYTTDEYTEGLPQSVEGVPVQTMKIGRPELI